ncbi:proteasome ATPase [Nesterenkonia halobia]|uniref:AAA ATPase forming ring-shaped complexes n=2 Tax=Nesterenkonia halobia TaxID=37922 RepID=A0ABP6RGT0_9MICC
MSQDHPQQDEARQDHARQDDVRQDDAEQLRGRLEQTRRQLDSMRRRTRELEEEARTAGRQNTQLAETLTAARGRIEELREALHADGQAPFSFATVIAYRPRHEVVEGREIEAAAGPGVDVLHAGRRMRVSLSPLLDPEELEPGAEVLLNEHLAVVAVLEPETTGEIARVKEVLPDDRLVILSRGEDERVVRLSPAASRRADQPVRVGDAVTVDLRTGTATEIVPLSEVEDVVLEETPDVSYADIGGLGEQITQIRDAVELPFQHADLFREHGLSAPKGILLYGPPGCGKTMIAKAVASSLAEEGPGAAGGVRSPFFLNIKGPELLNKYVGETERHIRVIFSRARERADAGHPVVVFFDEMEALFRTRGSGVSSDVETTIVPQLLAEIDGVETLDNVIVIGASNREDMIDPAILRPGRLDVKIRVRRPAVDGAREILRIHLGAGVPLRADQVAARGGRDEAVQQLVETVVSRLFPADGRAWLRLRHADGGITDLAAAEVVSGAVLGSIVDRAKKAAIKEHLGAGRDPETKGVTAEHLRVAVDDELADQQDLLSTADPQEWARVLGSAPTPVVAVERLAATGDRTSERATERNGGRA